MREASQRLFTHTHTHTQMHCIIMIFFEEINCFSKVKICLDGNFLKETHLNEHLIIYNHILITVVHGNKYI